MLAPCISQRMGRRADAAAPWCHDGVAEAVARRAWSLTRLRAESAGLLRSVRSRLSGRDLSLIAAGLTFYAGLAVVPLLVVTFALTAWLTSPERGPGLGAPAGRPRA